MLTLIHGSFEWLIAGGIVFIGLRVFMIKIARGHIMGTIASACVWYFVYMMHRGSTQGIMSATFAALLFDMFGLPLLKLFAKRH